MEEISSVDSFHTEVGDSALMQPETATTRSNEDVTTNLEQNTTECKENENEQNANEEAVENETQPTSGAANNEEDFEQISDGSFEVDENTQETKADAGTTLYKNNKDGNETDGITIDEIAEEEPNDLQCEEAQTNEEDADAKDTTVQQNEAEPIEKSESYPTDKSADEPNSSCEQQMDALNVDPDDVVDATPSDIDKSDMAMDVDEAESGNNINEVLDIEMHSARNSPHSVDNDNEIDALNISNNSDPCRDVDNGDNDDGIEADGEDEQASEKHADTEVEGKNAEAEDDEANNEAEQVDEDAEHGDEPVENVQEPEESDVCLIPDDTETEVTDAEKEQALLALENAEKRELEETENAEQQAAEVTAASTDDQTASDEQTETAAENTNADADAQANKQAGAEADAAKDNSEENNATCAEEAEGNDQEENIPETGLATNIAEAGSVTKTIIGWIVSITQACRQCKEKKICGFRYKKPENTDEFEYLCEQACCDALLKEEPGKFFLRRKKFLVEELSNEQLLANATINVTSSAGTDESAFNKETDNSTAVAANNDANLKPCIHCKDLKQCKYFLKQDQDTYYICNDDCFNLLNVEEPDKYKLKRHSIRVRNIGATTLTAAADSSAKKTEARVVARTESEAEAARLERIESFRRRCSECHEDVVIGDKHLRWETMDFCSEVCLGKYQRIIGSNCHYCNGEVSQTALGKYCVRFGFDVRQFCCAACLNVYKKGLKTCSCCLKDISSANEGFLAPVGDKEQFKDFCSQACLRRYDSMCNPKKKLRNDICSVCNNEKPVRVEMILEEKEIFFCSNPCFSAFKFVSNVDADQCGLCCKYFERKAAENYTIYVERHAKVFCSQICVNVYIIINRHIVSCQWCKVKKYNFDMIYKHFDERDILICSLTCLSNYGVSVKAFSRAVTKCDNCNTSTTPQYHLTMSDASIRNFCTYQCVMQFQNQFARVPLTLENELPSTSKPTSQQTTVTSTSNTTNKNGAPFPTGLPKRVKLKYTQQQAQMKASAKGNSAVNKKGPVMPVISNVTSLAGGEAEGLMGNVGVRRSRGRPRALDSPPPVVGQPFRAGRPRKQCNYLERSPSPIQSSSSLQSNNVSRRNSLSAGAHSTTDYNTVAQTETKIITLPPYPPTVRNVSASCKPQTVTVGFQSKPPTRDVEVQTEKDYSNKVLIPVPVPIYVPQPMYMYSAPFPVPVPIPLPIPVPIFIPTTRNSAQGILKEIRKIQERMPTDPLEAELLMMAEMVAEEKNDSDSDSDNEIKPDPALVQLQYNNSVQQDVEVTANTNPYGEDVLQMALKMATGDYDQPTVDLESAMTANTITNPPPDMVGHDGTLSQMNVHHLDQQQHQQHMLDAQRSGRGRKRIPIASPIPTTPPRNNRSPVKRPRLQELDTQLHQQQQTVVQEQQSPQPVEKADANMCLKFTFGVNAWKQWVMTKNADIEKSSMRRRTFKTDLLQMTADELNYSLCLFVKEVRKPNGTEYAPDTIYYLVLGIQQYLYSNGRIDNIFYDPYYERFTECLDEIARKFSVLYNDSHYIVTRVEEEHLWECKQLGAHSPHVLLSTLMFFNTKHFNLTTVDEHMQLSFSHIMKHWKRTTQTTKMPGTRNVLLRFYPPQASTDANSRKKKVYEQQENETNPLRCPVRLYEFYLSKCPESVKTRNDVFYLQPERSCVPDSPVWYSTQALSQDALQRMLHRVKMVKEINIALLTI